MWRAAERCGSGTRPHQEGPTRALGEAAHCSVARNGRQCRALAHLAPGGNPTRRAVGSGPVAALQTLLPAPQLLGNCIRVHVTWQPPFNTQHAIPPHPSFSVRPQHALNAFLVTGHLHCWMEAWSRVKALQAAAKVLACTEARCEKQQAAGSCAVMLHVMLSC